MHICRILVMARQYSRDQVIEFLDLPDDDIDMEMEEEFCFEGSDDEVSDLERFVRITNTTIQWRI